MTIVPIKTFEEMNAQEQREHLESLLEDSIFEQGTSMEEFLSAVSAVEIIKKLRRRKTNNGAYLSSRRIAEATGLHEDTIRDRFRHKTKAEGVDKHVYSGRNRKTYPVIRISRAAAAKEFPDVDWNKV